MYLLDQRVSDIAIHRMVKQPWREEHRQSENWHRESTTALAFDKFTIRSVRQDQILRPLAQGGLWNHTFQAVSNALANGDNVQR